MFDSIIAKVVLTVIRRAVIGAGAGLVTSGVATQDQWGQVTGAIMVIVPIAFSIYNQIQTHNAKKDK